MAVADYAVVTFIDDKDVSEVPSKWIEQNDDEATCWWPMNSKNITTLIAKQAQPDKETWTSMPVIVEKYCATLAKARKIAENSNYQTTDDDNLGKGRRIIQKKLVSSSSDDDIEDEPPSKSLKRLKAQGKRKQDILADLPSVQLSQSPFDETKESTSIDKANGSEAWKESSSVLKSTHRNESDKLLQKTSSQFANNINEMTNVRNVTITGEDEENTISSGTTREGGEMIVIKNTIYVVPRQASLPAKQKFDEEYDELSQVMDNSVKEIQSKDIPQEYAQIIIRMLAKLQIAVENLSQKVERGRTPAASGDIEAVKTYLPLKSIKEIKDFEDLIRVNSKIKEQFNTFVRRIGGRTAREDIHRILKKIFTNSCGELCSWKGRKGNFCVEDLLITKAINDAVMETYPEEKEFTFQESVAVWFRFSKQRDSRDTAKTSKKRIE